mgnify:CR=1 FL=1
MMSPVINYSAQEFSFGDLFAIYDVHFTDAECARLLKKLEKYLTNSKRWRKNMTVHLTKFDVILCNPDEVGHLYFTLL